MIGSCPLYRSQQHNNTLTIRMPLPDERKREAVSSLIARFQNLADADKAEKEDEARRSSGSRSSNAAGRFSLDGNRPSLDGIVSSIIWMQRLEWIEDSCRR